MTANERRAINLILPKRVCLRNSIPCGQRREDYSCKCERCAYNILTTGLPMASKELLLGVRHG
jgi:hypothetical protein